jgi:hypothetical protein
MQHLDEGTIHAWIDGELSSEQGDEIAAHVAECPECAAMVAEARGLVAASTRILTALDDIPGGVIPSVPDIAPAQIVRRRWYQRTDVRAAAALLLVAGTSLVVVQRGVDSSASRATFATESKRQPSPASAEAAAAGPATGTQVMSDALSSSAVGLAPRAAKPAAPESPMSGASSRRAELKSGFVGPRDQVAQANAMANAQSSRLQARDEAQLLKEEAAKSRAADVAFALPPLARVGVAAPPMVAAPTEGRSGGSAPGVVRGRVIDKRSGKGVSEAQVVIEGTNLAAATDKDGDFKIANVPPGDQRLRVRRIGYDVATIPLSKESRDAEGATVALTPSQTALEAVVVTGAENAPTVSTAGAAVSKGVAEAPLRVVRVDSTAGVKQTTYEVSKGLEVTLTESPVETVPERDDAVRHKVAVPQSAAAPVDVRQRENVLSGRVAGAAASAATVAPNTITWTDRGRKFVLTGRLATKDLEAVKTRLMQMRR